MANTKITNPELFNLGDSTSATQLPVMTTTQRIAMTGLSDGEMIFNSTTDKVEYWDGTKWYGITYEPTASYSSYQAWDVGNPASYPGAGNTFKQILTAPDSIMLKGGGVSYNSTNKSFVFNASNGSNGAFMNFNQSTMNIPYSYSVSYWINIRVQNTGQSSQNLYGLGYSPSLRVQYFSTGYINVYTIYGYLGTFNTGMSIGNWYNITHTFTSGNMKTYIALEGDTVTTLKQNVNSSMPNPNTASTWFGSNVQNYNANFDGQLRLIEFYNSTLSQSEINAIVVRGSQP